MEFILNSIWVISVLLAGTLLMRSFLRRQGGRSVCLALTAVACLAVLLFPSISVTDDLSSFQAAAEESDAAVRLLQNAPAADFIFPVAALLLLFSPLVVTGLSCLTEVHSIERVYVRRASPRAPPAFSLL
jgi:hypothetical protein